MQYIKTLMKTVPQQIQTQSSLNDQLHILADVANRLGLYEAADYLRDMEVKRAEAAQRAAQAKLSDTEQATLDKWVRNLQDDGGAWFQSTSVRHTNHFIDRIKSMTTPESDTLAKQAVIAGIMAAADHLEKDSQRDLEYGSMMEVCADDIRAIINNPVAMAAILKKIK